jgi:hypothetical protein
MHYLSTFARSISNWVKLTFFFSLVMAMPLGVAHAGDHYFTITSPTSPPDQVFVSGGQISVDMQNVDVLPAGAYFSIDIIRISDNSVGSQDHNITPGGLNNGDTTSATLDLPVQNPQARYQVQVTLYTSAGAKLDYRTVTIQIVP